MRLLVVLCVFDSSTGFDFECGGIKRRHCLVATKGAKRQGERAGAGRNKRGRVSCRTRESFARRRSGIREAVSGRYSSATGDLLED